MAKYVTLFDIHTDYQTYITGNDKILPNVSYCEDNNDVHYNPFVPETRLVGKFNVESTSEATFIISTFDTSAISQFSEIEIDGVVQPSVVSSYTFDTTGEHTVKYTLVDLTEIGQNAFRECTGLTSVTIPNSVTSINSAAFQNCTGLTSVTIGNSVTTIGSAVFYGCTGLTSITIPDSVTTMGTNAFRNCSGLTSITIPNSVTSISAAIFHDCTSLISVAIPNSVTTIGNSALRNCSSLTSVIIGNSVTSISLGVFINCSSLTSIISLATTAPTISNSTFQDIKTGGTLTVPTGSTGYDVWMGTGNYYLGKYNWTKVEQ